MAFDFELFNSDELAVHCPTEEEAVKFLSFLDEHGYSWCRGTNLSGELNWEHYMNQTAYSGDEDLDVSYGDIAFYQSEGYQVIPFSSLFYEDVPFEIADESELLSLLQN